MHNKKFHKIKDLYNQDNDILELKCTYKVKSLKIQTHSFRKMHPVNVVLSLTYLESYDDVQYSQVLQSFNVSALCKNLTDC